MTNITHRASSTPPMRLDPQMFQVLLEQMDCGAMAEHSALNHHVEGMHYLCLARTSGLTVKVYLMEEPRNAHSGFLVHPHTHRYSFASTVLAGALLHCRFERARGTELPGEPWWDCFEYHAETGALRTKTRTQLIEQDERCPAGANYFNTESDIHTLMVRETEPLLLGLVQFADIWVTSDLYLPASTGRMAKTETRKPLAKELGRLRDRALELLSAGACAGVQP